MEINRSLLARPSDHHFQKSLAVAAGLTFVAVSSPFAEGIPTTAQPKVIVGTQREPVAPGKFQPTWESLQQYQTPEWFRDAKFGIWAHWGPQCEPEAGDWYARSMYQEGSGDYKSHLQTLRASLRGGIQGHHPLVESAELGSG